MKKKYIPYDPWLKDFARKLRKNSTLGEVMLWKRLRKKQFHGYDFHRQKPLLSYIVDFYCKDLNLVIEIDGSSHKNPKVEAKDARKENDLKSIGLFVLRITEADARYRMDDVLRSLEEYLRYFNGKIAEQ